jgi:hypothetical protein
MYNIQQNIIENSKLFIDQFVKSATANWRMAIVSSDTTENPYLGFQGINGEYFDRDTFDPVDVFTDAFSRLGTNGSPTEKFFDPPAKYFQVDRTFVRKGAFLVFIFVTDEYEQSTSYPSAGSFLNKMTSLKEGDGSLVKAFGAFEYSDIGCDRGDKYAGGRFEDLINATGGTFFPACSSTFGQDLARVGQAIVALLKPPQVVLRDRPELDTLKVLFKGKELPSGPKSEGGIWYYDKTQNVVVFYDLSFVPNGEAANVEIVYDEDDGYDDEDITKE